MLKKIQKLSELKYTLKNFRLQTFLGNVYILQYTKNQYEEKLHAIRDVAHKLDLEDIKEAEFIEHTLYVTIIPDEFRINYIINDKTYKYENKKKVFIDMLVKNIEYVFETKFTKMQYGHSISYIDGKYQSFSIGFVDERTFKKGVVLCFTFRKELLKYF